MQQNFYEIGKNGTYSDICKNYTWRAEIDILKGLKDRKDHKGRRKLLIKCYNNLNISFTNVCGVGIRLLIDYVLKNTLEEYTFDYGLRGACQGGHMDLVNLMIEKGADNWDLGLIGACEGGHLDLVNLMIEKGANNWNWGLEGACTGGHLDLVNLMIEKGADVWNSGLWSACRSGHRDLVDLMIEKGANDLNQGFDDACAGNHWKIAEYLIILGANCNFNEYKDYYEYLARKLIKTKTSMHGLYYELNYLVSLY